MPTYKFVWPTGYSAHMTVPQYDKACEIAQRFDLTHTVTVHPSFGAPDEILINTGTMWIAVLPDGSSHS